MDLREYQLKNLNDLNQRHPWEIARLWSVETFLKRSGFSSKDTFTVLDFGAGDLFVAYSLKKAFPKADIISIDQAYTPQLLAELKSGHSGVSAFNAIEQWKNDRKADVVLLLDVLEHCPNDEEILQLLRQSGKVQQNALWVVSVPAFNILFTRYDTFLGHFRRYTYPHLAEVTGKVGLSLQSGGYFFSSLVLPRTLSKILEVCGLSNTQTPRGLNAFRPKPWVGTLIASVLYADFWILTLLNRLGIRFPGLSCYVLARG